MRVFTLERTTDVSHVSGTGRVAEGCEFSDGSVVLKWIVGDYPSTVVWPGGIKAVLAVHGHSGQTTIRWRS